MNLLSDRLQSRPGPQGLTQRPVVARPGANCCSALLNIRHRQRASAVLIRCPNDMDSLLLRQPSGGSAFLLEGDQPDRPGIRRFAG